MKITSALSLLFTVLSVLMLNACGSEVIQGPEGPQGPKGDTGSPAPVPEFVGEYYLPYSGYVIITINHENLYAVDATLQSLNPDNTICSLNLDSLSANVHNDVILYSGTIAMAAGNCRSDSNSALLTAAAVTYQYEVTISLQDGNLQVDLLVMQTSSGIRTVVIERRLQEQ